MFFRQSAWLHIILYKFYIKLAYITLWPFCPTSRLSTILLFISVAELNWIIDFLGALNMMQLYSNLIQINKVFGMQCKLTSWSYYCVHDCALLGKVSANNVCFPFTTDKPCATQFPCENCKLPNFQRFVVFFLSFIFFGFFGHNEHETFFAHWRPLCRLAFFSFAAQWEKIKENIKVTIGNAIISMINDAPAETVLALTGQTKYFLD